MPEIHYWAIVGRLPFDDEDTCHITESPCTRAEAVKFFEEELIADALAAESEPLLRRRIGTDETTLLSNSVIITHRLCSNSVIYNRT